MSSPLMETLLLETLTVTDDQWNVEGPDLASWPWQVKRWKANDECDLRLSQVGHLLGFEILYARKKL